MTTQPQHARRSARGRRTFAAALALGLGLSLAACGGGDDAPAEQAAPAASRDQRSTSPSPRQPIAMPAPVGSTQPVDELAELKRQVLALQREMAELRRQIAQGAGRMQQAEAAPPADPRQDETAREDAERMQAERMASSEAAFRTEPQDPRWSRETLAAVRNTLAQADASLQSRVRHVECRSRSCRVEIGAGNGTGGAAEAELPVLLSGLAGTLPQVSAGRIDQGDGQQATVLYLSR